MKVWLRSICSAVFVSLLTVALHGKAYAEPENQTLPDEAPTQIIETGESTLGDCFDPVSSAEADPTEVNTNDDPQAEDASVSETEAEGETEQEEALDLSGAQVSSVAASVEDTSPTDALVDVVIPEDKPEAEMTEESLAEGGAVEENSGSEAMLFAGIGESVSDGELPAEETVAEIAELAADSSYQTAVDSLAADGEEETSEAELMAKSSSSDNSLIRTEDGIYILVNHSGTEELNENGDITILAAGVNRISSISGTGKVRIAGTGILLVDDLQGSLELLTLTDIYDAGSVAVFVRQADGTYQLVNGTVPGILDEEYRIDDCTLVIPEGGNLLLCGTGAEPLSDGSVVYYHGTDHGYHANSFYNVVEMTGKLTIVERAELIIRQGASVILQNLKTLGHGDLEEDGRYRHPTLSIEDGGKLTVDGTVGNGGIVWIGEDSSLYGGGSITTDRLGVGDPSSIENSHVSLSAKELYLYGDGTIPELMIRDTNVHPGSSVKISGLVNSGSSLMILPCPFELNIAKVDGTLVLRQDYEYDTSYEPHQYNDSNKVTISGRNIRGNGEICFDSGIYVLQAGTRLNKVTVSNRGGGLVYDYAEVLPTSQFPLHMQPDNLPYPTIQEGQMIIPVAAGTIAQISKRNYGEEVYVEGIIPDLISVTATVSVTETGTTVTLDLDQLKQDLTEKAADLEGKIAVELLRKSADGTLHTDFYRMSTLSGSVNADDLCLIRILVVKEASTPEPDTESTMTGMNYTGSGILGGQGAGSVHFGNPVNVDPNNNNNNNNNSNNNNSNNNSQTDDEKENTDKPGTDDNVQAAIRLQVWATQDAGVYTLHAKIGEQELSELDAYVDVILDYTADTQISGRTIYVVFRNAEGKLVAFRASYGQLSRKLHFQTNLLGRFVILAFEFDGEEFSDAFYEALEACAEIALL